MILGYGCQHANQHGNFCTTCGFDLSIGKDIKCKKCNYSIKSEDNYCGNCGASRYYQEFWIPNQSENTTSSYLPIQYIRWFL